MINNTNESINELSKMTTKDLVINVWKRFLQFPAKLIGWNGIAFITVSVFVWFGKVSEWVWLASLIVILFGMKGLQAIIKIAKAWKGN